LVIEKYKGEKMLMKNILGLIMSLLLFGPAVSVAEIHCLRGGVALDGGKVLDRPCTETELREESLRDEAYDKKKKKEELAKDLKVIAPAIGVFAAIVGLFKALGFVGSFGLFVAFTYGALMFFEPMASIFFAGGVAAVIFGFATRKVRIKKREDRQRVVNEEIARNDTQFEEDDLNLSYSRKGFSLSFDKEKQLVEINGASIKLSEFDFVTGRLSEACTTGGSTGGGYQAVTGPGAAPGSWETKGHVYVPSTTTPYVSTLVQTGYSVTIYRRHESQKAEIASIEFSLKSEKSYQALERVLKKIQVEGEIFAQESASNALDLLSASAGLDKEFLSKARWGADGALREVIAVDRSGNSVVIYNDGADTWTGTLKGASAQIIDNKLEVKVDDAAYRDQYLSDRHFTILLDQPRDVLVEWESRINLLATKLNG